MSLSDSVMTAEDQSWPGDHLHPYRGLTDWTDVTWKESLLVSSVDRRFKGERPTNGKSRCHCRQCGPSVGVHRVLQRSQDRHLTLLYPTEHRSIYVSGQSWP